MGRSINFFGEAEQIPPQLQQKLALAQVMQQRGMSSAPVGSVMEGVGRLSQAIAGSYKEQKLEQEQKAETERKNAALANALTQAKQAPEGQRYGTLMEALSGADPRLGVQFQLAEMERMQDMDAARQEQEMKYQNWLKQNQMEPVTDANGNIIGQRNIATGEVTARPDALKTEAQMRQSMALKHAGRSSVNVSVGNEPPYKIPNNFMLKDPNDYMQGVVPIPGGPGEQIGAEQAGRVGLANDALSQLPEAKEMAESGALTGPLDYAKGKLGWGDQGRLYRELSAGSEAITRMLTGAGMNMSEAKREASQYLPQITDTPESLSNKVEQLNRRLENINSVVIRGRGEIEKPKVKKDDPIDAEIRALEKELYGK